MISADPAHTIVCVRIPASLNRSLRSNPIAKPSATAYTMRSRYISSSFNLYSPREPLRSLLLNNFLFGRLFI